MGNKSFFSRIFNSESGETKALQDRLDNVVGEFHDQFAYEAKFLDNEATGYSGGNHGEFNSVDQQIDTAALQRVYSTETWVYAAVTAIAKDIAGLPVKLEKRREYTKKVTNEVTGEEETVKQEAWIDASGEKLFRRFGNPNPYCSKAELFMLLTIDLCTAGEYYIYLDSDQDLSVLDHVELADEDPNSPFNRLRTLMTSDTPIKGMYRIPPSLIKPVLSEDHTHIEGYEMMTDRGSFAFGRAEMLHVKLPNPNNPFQGLSPLIAAFKPVLLDRFSTEHMIRFYKSGARLGGVIETEKSLNKEQLARFQRSFEAKYTGRQNHHRTLILPPGMKYTPVGANPAEMALLEFCRYNREAVLSAFGVPPIKVGVMDHANYANANVQLKMFFTNTIIPMLTFIEDGFSRHPAMLPGTNVYRIKFDLTNVEALQENYKDKAEAASKMLDAGLTFNEVRRRMWNAEAVAGGDKVKGIEELKNRNVNPFESVIDPAAAAPADGATPDTANQEAIAENQVTDPTLSLNGAQVQAMVAIVQQIAQGFLPRASGVEMIVASFSLPREVAERIVGEVGRGFEVDPNKPSAEPESVDAPGMGDTGKGANDPLPDAQAGAALLNSIQPTDATFSQRVNQLVQEFVAGGMPLADAIPKAIEQARVEGFTDPDPNDPNGGGSGNKPTEESAAPEEGKDGVGTAQNPEVVPTAVAGDNCPKCSQPKKECSCDEKDGGKPTLAQFLAEEIAKATDATVVDQAFIDKLKAEYDARYGQKEDDLKTYANGATKADIVNHWKSFIGKSQPLIDKRQAELAKFFDSFRRVVMFGLGANLKAFGMHKARNNDDIEEILKIDAFKKLIDDYVDQVDKTLKDAYEQGYADTLVDFKFEKLPNEVVVAELRKYAADKVTGIVETTREQLKSVLVDAFERGLATGEVGKILNEKFAEMTQGRAMTIARTETLTAVSLGKAAKRQEFVKQFPDKPLLKMWVSAQDEHVRDSHEEMDGKSVPVDEHFPNGLAYPRDPSGPPEEVINCRCDDITYAAEDRDVIEETLPAKDEE